MSLNSNITDIKKPTKYNKRWIKRHLKQNGPDMQSTDAFTRPSLKFDM